MARASGRLVMTGNKDGEFSMNVEFAGDGAYMPPHPLRIDGYYVGKGTSAEMIADLSRRASAGMDDSKPDVTGSIGNIATGSEFNDVRTVESQSSTGSLKAASPGLSLMDTVKEADSDFPRQEDTAKLADSPEEDSPTLEDTTKQGDAPKEEDTTKRGDAPKEEDTTKRGDSPKEEDTTKQGDSPKEEDITKEEDTTKEEDSAKEDSVKEEATGKEVLGRSQAVVGLQPHLGPFAEKPVRAMGRAPIGPLRRDLSSVDDVETEVQDVDDYYVVGEDVNKPVSLCLVPLEQEDQNTIAGLDCITEFSLRGKSNGADIMRPISAWKLVFLESLPFQILVKIAQKSNMKWVKLGKPCSSFKETADGVFIVAKVLAFLKKEPQASEDRVWNHLFEGDVAPENFRDHLRMQYPLMEKLINLDPVLKNSGAQKTLVSLFDRAKEVNSGKRAMSDRDSSDEIDNRPLKKSKAGNVVQRTEKATRVDMTSNAALEDVNMGESESEEEYYDEFEDESEDELGDSFCIFCDDGGTLLCCDGPCMRSFHATVADGRQSNCKSLGFSEAAVAKMVGKWLCKNCNYKQHQCYVCGELGASTSDQSSGVRQEVFVCNVACCGKFYHPKCIASKLTAAPSERGTLALNIQAGKESFTCTLHTCKACGEGENREVFDLILVKCRRCPIAWHRKCLPRSICFGEDAVKRNFETRAWKFGEKHLQFICYCTDHKVIGDLGTPLRNHVKFALTPVEVKEFEEFEKQKKRVDAVTMEPVRYGAKASSVAASMGKSAEKKYPSGDLSVKARPDIIFGSSSLPPPRPNISKDAVKRSEDAGERRTVESIVARSKLMVTEETVKSKHETNLPGIYKPKKIGQFMKKGMVDSILEAAKAAVEKIQHSRSNDALMICDRQTLVKLFHEEDRMRTYLAPTLFGKRYTSYGRHFTKVKKLEKVVEILQPYIWERDMIVDFSCGDNSFCRLLRKSLSEAGKTNCQFKNFDLFPSKDAFGFEQKDWFEVGMKDCGPGKNLVIGLNPPFAFVEKFVAHALGMNPRLLVLIVPPMKKKLEHLGYDCLVKDASLMAEKSFYLPGSVNEKNKKVLEQGNNVAPHFFIYCSKQFSERYKGSPGVNVPELFESGPSTAANLNRRGTAMIWKGESKPATKPAPKPEPTANLFIPSAQKQPQPGQARNQRTKTVKPKSALRSRDPRQALQVARNSTGVAVARLPDAQQVEGEIPSSSQGQAPFRNNTHPRPTWRLNDLLPGPPPGPPPAHVQQAHVLNPRPFGGPVFPPPLFIQGQAHYRPHPDEYSPFEPGLFPPGSGGHRMPMGHNFPPYRPAQHIGFHQRPRPGSSHSWRQEPPPPVDDDDESFGGWIDG